MLRCYRQTWKKPRLSWLGIGMESWKKREGSFGSNSGREDRERRERRERGKGGRRLRRGEEEE